MACTTRNMKRSFYRPGLFLLLLMVGMQAASAQKRVTTTENLPRVPIRWNYSYLGEMGTHPGFKVGMERHLTGFKSTKTIQRKSGDPRIKERTRIFFFTVNAGTYYHRNNNLGMLVNSEIGYRKIRAQGLKSEALLGIGYIQNFWPGTTYQVQADGSITSRTFTSNGGFSTHFSLGFGRDLTFIRDRRWAWHFRPTVLWQLPYNTGIVTRFFLELGITCQFSKK